MNKVSVHAISMLYELRVLSARLAETTTQLETQLFVTDRDIMILRHCESLVDLLLSKIERTGEYIAALEADLAEGSTAASAAVLGEDG